ncbi:hypothetical protein GGI22_002027 [Coemansia erecta]|nr:hypothetical protein GGI22_002027 [Coemansia erecta]
MLKSTSIGYALAVAIAYGYPVPDSENGVDTFGKRHDCGMMGCGAKLNLAKEQEAQLRNPLLPPRLRNPLLLLRLRNPIRLLSLLLLNNLARNLKALLLRLHRLSLRLPLRLHQHLQLRSAIRTVHSLARA